MEEYYCEVSDDEIEAVASYWYDVLERSDLTKSEESLAVSYLALYTTIRELEEMGENITPNVPPTETLH